MTQTSLPEWYKPFSTRPIIISYPGGYEILCKNSKEAADYLKISLPTLRKMIKTGKDYRGVTVSKTICGLSIEQS